MGKIQAVCISDVRGIAKRVVPEGLFKVDWGIEGDAHAGHWHRQVSLLGLESIEDFRRRGGNVDDALVVEYGDRAVLAAELAAFQIEKGHAVAHLRQILQFRADHARIRHIGGTGVGGGTLAGLALRLTGMETADFIQLSLSGHSANVDLKNDPSNRRRPSIALMC